MSKKEFKKIPAIAAIIIRLALSTLKNQLISRIPNDNTRNIALVVHEYTGKTFEALSDDDYLNGKQIEQIWLEFVVSEAFQSEIKILIFQGIDKIEGVPNLRKMLTSLVQPVFQMVSAFADGNVNDGKQVLEVWLEHFKDAKNVSEFFGFILDLVKDTAIAKDMLDTISELIAESLKNVRTN